MGVPVQWRKTIIEIIRRRNGEPCAFPNLLDAPPGFVPAQFDVVVVDLTQELASMKHAGEASSSGEVMMRRVKRVLYSHLNVGEVDGEVPAAQLLVGCMDNHYRVPRNKSFVQSSRDTPSEKHGGEDEEEQEGPPVAVSPVVDPGEYDQVVSRARTNAGNLAYAAEMTRSRGDTELARNCRTAAEANFSDATHFLISEGPFPAVGDCIWRSICLRWQLTRLVTEGILSMNIPDGRLLLLDEGLPLNQANYAALYQSMVADHEVVANSRSPYENAALVGHLMGSCLRRLLLAPGHKYTELPITNLGEADHKIEYYVQRMLPIGVKKEKLAASKRVAYLVKSQDTDVLWQLVMHMRHLVNPLTGNVDEVDVWLDSQTPNDRVRGISQPYRFINVVSLWRQLMGMLTEEFPRLKNPLEALFFVIFCNNNDYVEGLAPGFRIGPGKIWTVFASAAALASSHPTYPVATGKGRATVPGIFPGDLASLVADMTVAQERPTDKRTDAIKGEDILVHDTPIFLRRTPVLSMLYYLIQTSPFIQSIAKKYKGTEWGSLLLSYVPKAEDIVCAIAHLHELYTNDLAPDARAAIPPLFGVPTVASMKARVAQIEWTMNYYINGWKTGDYTHNWFKCDGEYSLHGWSLKEVTSSPLANPNSQYLYAEYVPAQTMADTMVTPGHYRFYEAERCFEVKSSLY